MIESFEIFSAISLKVFISCSGALLFIYRMKGNSKKQSSLNEISTTLEVNPEYPLVSIIVPARNEELNISACLRSLIELDYPNKEILLIDDESEDETRAIASQFSSAVKVVNGLPRPNSEWKGKSWACEQGFKVSRGQWILFTDADTTHLKHGLNVGIRHAQAQEAALLCSLPFHKGFTSWEKLSSSFHFLVFFITNAFKKPSMNRLYCNGQYLLFNREAYQQIGGHKVIRSELAEDLALAKQVLNQGLNYEVYPFSPLYQVRMYNSFLDFLKGWKRNLRLGLKQTKWKTLFEIFLVFSAMTHPIGLTALMVAILSKQKKFGNFSTLAPLCLPLWAICFCLVSLSAMIESIFNLSIAWRGRKYL